MSTASDDPMRMPAAAVAEGRSSTAGSPPVEAETGSTASIGTIVSQLSSDFTTLMKQEVELAKAEVASSAKAAGMGVGLYGGTGFAVYFSALFVSIALWWWVGSSIGLGWSALVGAAVWALIGAVLALRARRSFKTMSGMTQTVDTARQIPDALKGKDHSQ